MDLQFVFGNPGKKGSKKKNKGSVAKKKKTSRLKPSGNSPEASAKGEGMAKRKKHKKAKKAHKARRKPRKARKAVKAAKKAKKTSKRRKAPTAKQLAARAKFAAAARAGTLGKGRKHRKGKKAHKKVERTPMHYLERHLKKQYKKTVKHAKRKLRATARPKAKKPPTEKQLMGRRKYQEARKQEMIARRIKLGLPIPKKDARELMRGEQAQFHFGNPRKRKHRGRKKISRKFIHNPLGGAMNKVEQYLGHSMQEVGGLAAGGAIYGAVNSLMAKLPGVKIAQSYLVKVPVVGASLAPLIMGALIHKFLGHKSKALDIVAKGLIGASVVGMGVQASQFIPGLAPAKAAGVAGIDFYPNPEFGGDADFGREADFGAVEYSRGHAGAFGNIEQYAGRSRDQESGDYGVSSAEMGELELGETISMG